VAYITGRKDFRRLSFMVSPAVLTPRPETEELVEAALEIARNGQKVLDLCTGSGCAAVSIKFERPELDVDASDVSGEALNVAMENAKQAGASVNFIHSDLFAAIPGPYNIILSNPPYVPAGLIGTLAPEVLAEPRLALDGGPDGLCLIRRIVAESPQRLCPGGTLLLEADGAQMPEIAGLLKAAGFSGVKTRRDLSGTERVIMGILA
jgi:release factor glutamine methyltransferase